MSQNFVINGTTYPFPDVDDQEWGQQVTDWANAVTAGMLQKAGGTFTLTADVDFGANFGLKSIYYKSRATNPATTGQVRLGNAEVIAWRNAANSANVSLSVDSSNRLAFSGTIKGTTYLFDPQSSPPTPAQGMVYFNSTDLQFYGYNGTEWVIMG